jgi:hypothetical protein
MMDGMGDSNPAAELAPAAAVPIVIKPRKDERHAAVPQSKN